MITSVAGFSALVGGAGISAEAETKTDKLDQSIETLKKAGIDVKTEEHKIKVDTHTEYVKKIKDEETRRNQESSRILDTKGVYEQKVRTQEKAKASYEKALASIKKTNEKIKAENDAKIQAWVKDVARIDAENNKRKAEYEKESARVKALNEASKQKYEAEKASVDAKYNEELKQYEAKLNTYKTEKAEYDEQLAAFNKKNSASSEKHAEYEKNVNAIKDIIAKHQGYDGTDEVPTEQWKNRGAVTIANDIKVVSEGTISSKEDLSNRKYTIHAYSESGKLTDANVVTDIRWESGKPVPYNGSTIVQGNMVQKDYERYGFRNKIYDVTTGGTTEVWSVKSGEWFMIPNAVTLKNGEKKGLWVRLTKGGTKLRYGGDWFTIWNSNGALNYLDGAHGDIDKRPQDKVTVDYRVEDEKEYFWAAAMIDLDGGQHTVFNSPNMKIVGQGGGVSVNGDAAKSNLELGYGFGKNKGKKGSGQALDGLNSAPDGVYTYVGFTKTLSYTIENYGPGAKTTAIANGDFGTKVNVNIVTAPPTPTDAQPPQAPHEPKKPTKPSVTPAKEEALPTPPKVLEKPNKPTEKELVKEPTPPKLGDITKPSVVVKKYVYEYEKTSSATSLKVREIEGKRSSSGNSLTIKHI